MCARTTDGAIVRVRIGDGSLTNWDVYRQIITDPNVAAQWTTWTSLYTGTHYAVSIEADAAVGAGYRVFTAKSDGLYVDNALKITQTGIVRIKPTFLDVGRVYFQTVTQDTDGERALKWWYTPNVNAGTPTVTEDCANYRWYRHDMVAAKALGTLGTYYYRFRSMALEAGARHKAASEWLTSELVGPNPSTASINEWNQVRHLKGPSEQAGYKTITNLFITAMSSSDWSSAYYLFYTERHKDIKGNILSNLRMPLFWSRSVGFPHYLSQPTPTGYSVWGFAGALEWGDYIFAAGNGRVLRRPKAAVQIDITDYVIDGNYELPREGGGGSGNIVCANPNNVVGTLLGLNEITEVGMTERRLILALGVRQPSDAAHHWKRDSAWWVSRLRKSKDGVKEHVEVEFGDFWHRMDIPFRDTYTLLGRLWWVDWVEDGTNNTTNYSNSTDPFYSYSPAGEPAWSLPRLRTVVSGNGPYGRSITRFAGWRGENAEVRALLFSTGGIVFRYQDEDNFFAFEWTGGDAILVRFIDGVRTVLVSVAQPSGANRWTVDFRWKRIRVYRETVLVIDHTLTDPAILTGHVGFISDGTINIEIGQFRLREWHQQLTTMDLVRTLLAYVDEHEVEVEDQDPETGLPDKGAEQINLIWGPQSDLDTPTKALRQLLDASKLQVVWREDE